MRVVEDTPLDRARHEGAISDIQWQAGTMYAADMRGDAAYNGNAAIIAANGDFRLQSPDGHREAMSRRPAGMNEDDGLRRVVDGYHVSISSTMPDYEDFNGSRLASVNRGLDRDGRRSARDWLCLGVKPRLAAFGELLDKLVNLYATHDAAFEFDKWRARPA